MKEHRGSGDKCREHKNECVFIIAFEKIFVRENECGQENDNNKWGETESNVGMEAETKEEATPYEIDQASCSQAFEKEIERKRKDK